jgi:hypothetical protein
MKHVQHPPELFHQVYQVAASEKITAHPLISDITFIKQMPLNGVSLTAQTNFLLSLKHHIHSPGNQITAVADHMVVRDSMLQRNKIIPWQGKEPDDKGVNCILML